MASSRRGLGGLWLGAALALALGRPGAAQGPAGAEWLRAGNTYAAAQRYSEALQSYQNAVIADPTLADAYYGMGWCYYYFQRYSEAEWSLRKTLQLKPGHNSAKLTLGEVLLERGKGREAEELFRPLVRQSPDDYGANVGLGRALLQQSRWADAKPYAEAAIRLRPDQPRPRVMLGRIHLRLGQYAPAEEALLAGYNLDPGFEPAARELIELYLVTKRPEQALPLLFPLLRKYPRDAGLLDLRVQAYRALGRKESLAQALEELVAALSAGTAALSATKAAPYRQELAGIYLEGGDLPGAERHLRAALQARPTDTQLGLLLARVLVKQGRTEEAARLLEKLPGTDSAQAELLAGIAETLLEKGQAGEALAKAREALAAAPQLEPALRVAVGAARKLGEGEAAVAYARLLLALHPADATRRAELADTLMATGHRGEALSQYHLLRAAGGEQALRALHTLSLLALTTRSPEYQLTVERALAGDQPSSFSPGLLEALLAAGRYQEAGERLEAALQKDPRSPELGAAQARLYRATGRAELAGPLLEQALAQNPTAPGLRLERALWLARYGAPAEALARLREVLSADPLANEAYRALLDTAERSGDFAAAGDFLLSLVLPAPGRPVPLAAPVALKYLGELYALRGGPEGALRELAALSDRYPDRVDLALASAHRHEEAGQWSKAAAAYERAALHSPAGETYLRLAVMDYSLGADVPRLLEAALAYFGRAVPDAEVVSLLTELQAGVRPASSESLAAVVALAGATPRSVAYYRSRTELFAQAGQMETLQSLLRARVAKGGRPEDCLALAVAQARAGAHTAALQALQALPPEQREDPEVALLRASLLRAAGDGDKALQVLDKLESGAEAVALLRGELLGEAERYPEALAEFMRALGQGAEAAPLLARLGQWLQEGKITREQLLGALEGAYATAPEAAGLRRFVVESLPGEDPAVQEWLAAHPALGPTRLTPRPGGPALAPQPAPAPAG